MNREGKRVGIAVAALAATALIGALLVVPQLSSAEAIDVEPFVQCQLEGCVAEAVGTSSGRLWLEHEDIGEDPVSGAVGIQRTYFRDDTTSSSFGPGWRSLLDTRLDTSDEVPTLVGFPSLPGAPLRVEDDVVTFADGTRWTFGAEGALVAVETRAGREFTIDRSDGGATIHDGDDPLIEIALEDGRVVQVSDQRSNDVGNLSYTYEAGRLVAVTSTDGDERTKTYRYGYNPEGGLDQVIDSGGETGVGWADERTVELITVGGQATTIQLPTSSHEATLVTLPGATKATEYRHDSEGRLVEVRQGDSVSLRREYSPEGRLVLERDAADERHFTWSDGQLTRVESEATGTTELRWDDLGRLVASRASGTETLFEYPGSTWAPSKVTEGEASTTYTYRDGALVEVIDPDGVTTEVGEVPDAGLVSGAGPLSEAKPECNAATDGLTLDDACRPIEIRTTDSEGATTAEAEITYDDYGRVATKAGPNGSEEFIYDDRGRVASVRRGETTFTNEYSHGRLSRVTTDDGSVFAEYGYDDVGRLERLTSSHGSVERSYDDSGRLERIENDGLEWEVTEHSRAGRPEAINTPYGQIEITYDDGGRVSSTEVGEYDERRRGGKITTTYDWDSSEEGDVARVTRAGYVSTLTFENGKLITARTPLGYWEYAYDSDHPGHLASVSGPDGTASYVYGTGSDGVLRVEQVKRGNQVRTLEWDEFGRLTKDEGGSSNRSFEYRSDGITEKGASDRKVTWDEAGLPARVESDGSTEIWTWNQNRTLRSITVEGRGLPLPSDEQAWTAAYDDDRRLIGFDKTDSDDDVAITWSQQPRGGAVPAQIADGSGMELSLGWTEIGELRRAGIGDQEWRIRRDGFRNVTAVSRSGESEGELAVTWQDGLPAGVRSGDDSLSVEQCTKTDCHVQLVVDKQTTDVIYSESSITAASGDRETVFTRDERGLITAGCQGIDGRQVCTDWSAEGKVGDRAELARFEELLGGTNGQLRGLASRPLPPDAPAIASLPEEFRPEGLQLVLPDEELEAAVAAAAPLVPETYRLHADGAAVRLAGRLAPTSVPLAVGPGLSTSVQLFGDDVLAAFESPLGADTPIGATASALEGVEPDSVLRSR